MPQQSPRIGPAGYLAKDYASFRQLLLDRLSLTLPQWREQHAADVFIALLEVVAYAGDQLSYFQDAVATEAYVGTARQRISVARHARLIGYRMHDGCNARTLVVLEVAEDLELDLDASCFITAPQGFGELGPVLLESALRAVPPSLYLIFEPMEHGRRFLSAADNRITVEAAEHAGMLRQGATSAKLRASNEAGNRLGPGDVLVFEQVRDPATGRPAAGRGTRHAVRLTSVCRDGDFIRVSWPIEDALTSSLVVSADTAVGRLHDLAVAHGNVLLVDHGVTMSRLRRLQPGLRVPEFVTEPTGRGSCVAAPVPLSGITRLMPLRAVSTDDAGESAAALLLQDPREALAYVRGITVGVPPDTDDPLPLPEWEIRPDLVHSGPVDRHVVVEFDDEDFAVLRFGDGVLGSAATPAALVRADVRLGNGSAGDVDADVIAHLVVRTAPPAVVRIHNPLAAAGVDPETAAAARLAAPASLRRQQERAVTENDYAYWAVQVTGVQAASAEITATVTGYRVDVFLDPLGREELDERLRGRVMTALDARRMVGHRVVVQAAHYVPLQVEISYALADDVAARSSAVSALRQALGSGRQPNGRLGFFHPDRFTFGTSVASSHLVAAAMATPGVRNARTLVLCVQGRPEPQLPDESARGALLPERHQIFRLDAGGAGSQGSLRLTQELGAR